MKIRDRIKEFRRVPAGDLLPNPRNWRKHPKAQAEALQGILAEIGFAGAVLARETENGLMLIDGHLRVETAGTTEIPVLILDVTAEEADKILATFDPLGAMATTDATKLKDILETIQTDNQALATMLSELAIDSGSAKEIIEDGIPEPPTISITKSGDLWLLGNHRVLCGDSTNTNDIKKLVNGMKMEMMFTDPPYGVNYEGGHFHSGNVSIVRKTEKLRNDNTTEIYNNFLKCVFEFIDGPCYMWFSDSKGRDVFNAVHENNYEIHAMLIWHKTNAKYAAINAQYKQRHEPFLYFKPKGCTLRWIGSTTEATLWSQDRDSINEFHPTQKPVALAAKAIKNHNSKSVLDLFLGSGSTLIACEQLGRMCYGMEINPVYCDVVIQRWESLTGKKAILESRAQS